VAYLGIVTAGAVVVPCNLLLSLEELTFILNDSAATALIVHPQLASGGRQLMASVASLRFRISTGDADDGALAWSDALAGESVPTALPPLTPEDLAAILYTSGTTGRPKGAMLSHGNLLANTRSVHAAMHWRPGQDVVLVVLPMFHAFAATVGMLTPLTCGCALVPLPKFDPDHVARAIQAAGATIFLGVPSMFTMFLKLKEDRRSCFGSLRFCVSGGAALPVAVLTQFEAMFGIAIYEGDGPTECSPVTCVNPIGGKAKPGTVGLPVPGVAMRILDDERLELPDGEVGEIAVRGANVFQGYWNLPEETAAAFSGSWFLTGDLGIRDEEGYFSIVDRKKDLIIVNGMNVYPRMIEEVLHRLPQIREVAVVGQPHRLHGEIPAAFVALYEPGSLTVSALRDWCRQHLGRHQVPREIEIVAALPRNAAGKILKRELRRTGEVERGFERPD
jgi:long-chain acyl-CoA synthetase